MATHFGLQSQTTRVSEEASCATVSRSRAWGYHPLHRTFSQQLWEDRCSDGPSPDYNRPRLTRGMRDVHGEELDRAPQGQADDLSILAMSGPDEFPRVESN